MTVFSRCSSGSSSAAEVDPAGPMRTRAPASIASLAMLSSVEPSGVSIWFVLSEPPSTPPPLAMSSTAKPIPRVCAWKSVASKPGGGANTPIARPTPSRPAVVVVSATPVLSTTVTEELGTPVASLLLPSLEQAPTTSAPARPIEDKRRRSPDGLIVRPGSLPWLRTVQMKPTWRPVPCVLRRRGRAGHLQGTTTPWRTPHPFRVIVRPPVRLPGRFQSSPARTHCA